MENTKVIKYDNDADRIKAIKESQKKWRRNNKEKVKLYNATYYKKRCIKKKEEEKKKDNKTNP